MKRITATIIGIIGLLGLGFAITAQAQTPNFGINPVRMTLTKKTPIQPLVVTNNGNVPVSFQATVKKWEQVNGKRVLTDTNDALASPVIFTVKPHSKQTVRVGLTTPMPSYETFYRLILKQLPSDTTVSTTSVKLRYKFSIPVFANQSKDIKPDVHWTIESNKLVGHNTGTKYARFQHWDLTNNGKSVADGNGLYYILPNKTITIPLNSNVSADTLTVKHRWDKSTYTIGK